jgi:hypothetical protein
MTAITSGLRRFVKTLEPTLGGQQLRAVSAMLSVLDSNGDGTLSFAELSKSLRAIPIRTDKGRVLPAGFHASEQDSQGGKRGTAAVKPSKSGTEGSKVGAKLKDGKKGDDRGRSDSKGRKLHKESSEKKTSKKSKKAAAGSNSDSSRSSDSNSSSRSGSSSSSSSSSSSGSDSDSGTSDGRHRRKCRSHSRHGKKDKKRTGSPDRYVHCTF